MSAPAVVRLQSLAGRSYRPVLGVAGQLLNAGTNVVTAYLASLLLGPEDFGRFVIAFAAVTIVLAAGRGLIGTTMMVHLPGAGDADREALVRSALGLTALIGLLATAVLALVAVLYPVLWVFVPWVLAALLQDVGRYAFLATGQSGRALGLDVAWAVVQGLVLVGVFLGGLRVTVGVVALAWGLGAVAGLATFAVLFHAVPADPRPWARATRDVAGWFTAVAVIGQVEVYLVLVLTGFLLAPADVGGVRAVQLLAFQPAVMLVAALLTVLQPLVVRSRSTPAALRSASRRIALTMMPVVGGLALLALLREPLMGLLFGQYVEYASLVVPIAAQSAVVAMMVVPLTVLRGLRRGPTLFAIQAGRTLATVLAAVVGMQVAGVDGLVWALVLTMAAAWALAATSARRAIAGTGDPA